MRPEGAVAGGENLVNPRIAAVDFFCGAGGMTRGMMNAGISVLAGVDLDSRVKETYELNNRPALFVKADITNFRPRDLRRIIDRSKWDYVIFAACAPCQPFSKLRKKKKTDGSERLLYKFAKVVSYADPDAIIVENVPGLKGAKGNKIWKRFVNKIKRLGYMPDSDILDAKDFGVPQTRRRLVLVAGKGFPIRLPQRTHGPPGSLLQPYVTVREAIGRYPPIDAGERSDAVPNHTARILSPLNQTRIRLVPPDGGSRKSLPSRYVLKCHKNLTGHSDTYSRMKWGEPSPTLTCKCTSITNGRFGHPSQDRAISIREAATLQTFPESFVFPEELNLATALIGNAVPVKLAEAVSQAVVQEMVTLRAQRRAVKLEA